MALLLALLLVAPLAVQQPKKEKPVHVSARVFVFAAETAPPDRDSTKAERDQAVAELIDALRHQKGLTIVDRQDDADVRVEVTDRETRDAGDGGFGGRQMTSLAEIIIRIHARGSAADVDLKGTGLGASRAAKDLADRLDKWIGRISRPASTRPVSSRRLTASPPERGAAPATSRQRSRGAGGC